MPMSALPGLSDIWENPKETARPLCKTRRQGSSETAFASVGAHLAARAGGPQRTTTRRLGVQLGRSAACVHGELRRLATTGFITLSAGSRGTLITVART